MADSRGSRPGSSGDLPHGPSSSRASVPPSEPRPSRASFSALADHAERPARLQMIVALILLLLLVAIPLYMWRRPRAESIATTSDKDASAEVVPAAPPEEKLALGDAKTLSCHDPGPKKTPPEQCDRLPDVEKVLAAAIQENASCAPKDAGGGTIAYVADVSFKKKSVVLVTPKESRTVKSDKVVAACRAAVRTKVEKMNVDSITKHDHSRYRVQIVATYPGATK